MNLKFRKGNKELPKITPDTSFFYLWYIQTLAIWLKDAWFFNPFTIITFQKKLVELIIKKFWIILLGISINQIFANEMNWNIYKSIKYYTSFHLKEYEYIHIWNINHTSQVSIHWDLHRITLIHLFKSENKPSEII